MKQRFRYQLEGSTPAGSTRERDASVLHEPAAEEARFASWEATARCGRSPSKWQFSIRPTFYQTAWFMAACIAGAVLLIGGAWRLHVRQVRHRLRCSLASAPPEPRIIHVASEPRQSGSAV
jgi:hypothetical protein